jgi:hypothetical protein
MAVSAVQGRAPGADNPRSSIPETKVTGIITPETTLRARNRKPATRNMGRHRVRTVRASCMMPIIESSVPVRSHRRERRERADLGVMDLPTGADRTRFRRCNRVLIAAS